MSSENDEPFEDRLFAAANILAAGILRLHRRAAVAAASPASTENLQEKAQDELEVPPEVRLSVTGVATGEIPQRRAP